MDTARFNPLARGHAAIDSNRPHSVVAAGLELAPANFLAGAHCSIVDFGKTQRMRAGGVGFQSYSNLFASLWWY